MKRSIAACVVAMFVGMLPPIANAQRMQGMQPSTLDCKMLAAMPNTPLSVES